MAVLSDDFKSSASICTINREHYHAKYNLLLKAILAIALISIIVIAILITIILICNIMPILA